MRVGYGPLFFVFGNRIFMTSELLSIIEYYEKEKGIARATMVEALEGALLVIFDDR